MRKFLKVLLYVLASILLLIILTVIYLQTPWGKNLVREKVVAYLHGKLKTEFVIQDLDYHIPNSIELKGVLLLDQNKDTLLSAGHLRVDLNMFALISKKISIKNLLLENVHANVNRNIPDSLFNFQYITDAFASKDTVLTEGTKTDTSASSLVYDISRVELKNINIRYNDYSGGTLFSVQLKNLLLRPQEIDMNHKIFIVKEFSVDGLMASFTIDTNHLAPSVKDTASTDLQLAVSKLNLKGIDFTLFNNLDSTYMKYQVGNLKTELKKFDLLAQFVELGDLTLEKANSIITLGKNTYIQPEKMIDSTVTANNWRVLAQSVSINQLNFALDNNNQIRQPDGIDYAHLGIKDFFFNAQDITYGPDTIMADLKHLVFKEKSGLSIRELRSKVFYSNKGAQLTDLYLLTPNTLLQDKIIVSYPSLEALKNNMDQMQMDIAFDKSKVGINDVLYFLDRAQRKQLLPYKNQSLNLTAKLSGYMNALLIDRLYLAGLHGTIVDIKGKLNGLPNSKKLFYDLDLNQVRTTYTDISPFLTDSLKLQVRIPEWMAITGKLSGGTEDYFPNVWIKTSDGNAKVKGSLRMSEGKNKEKYDLLVETQTLNLGKILRQPDSVLGVVTLVADVKGSGFDPKYMNTSFNAQIQSAQAMKYNYNNIWMTGNIHNQKAIFSGYSTDPNLDFTIDGQADLSNEYPAVYAKMDLVNVDLYALKLRTDTLILKGNILADFSSVNPDYPAGTFSWLNGHLTMPGTSVPLDTIIFSSNPIDSIQDIEINASKVLYATLNGHIPLTKIGNAVLSHINRHYHLEDTVVKNINQYDMELNGFVRYNGLVQKLLPTLKPFDTIKFHSGMSPDTFSFHSFIPRLAVGGNILDSTFVNIRENKDTFSYRLGLKKFSSGNIQLWNPSIRGLIRNDSIYTLVNIQDSAYKDQFTLGGSMTQDLFEDSSITKIRLFKGLRFDYEKWDVNPNNVIILSPEGFYIQNLDLTKNNQLISIKSQRPEPKSPFDLIIKNFELANITNMISRDTLIAEGQLNVTANLDLSDSFPKVNATASILNLKAFQHDVGEITFNAKNETENAYNAFLKLSGQGNDVWLKGKYFIKPENGNNFDFDLNMANLSLKSIEGLTFGAIRNSSGDLTGNLKITGTTEKPDINGELRTKNLQTTVKMLNAPFKMPSESISFSGQTITFNNFKINDLNNNTATLNGEIKSKNFKSFLLDLQFNANRWQPLHSVKSDNAEFYGDLILSSNLQIKGPATAPSIGGELTIHDSTDFTYALLDKGPGIVDHEGIVRFIDHRDTIYLSTVQPESPSTLSGATQMNVNVNIEEKAKFQVLIDPASGDMLQVMGEAQLNAFIAPDGTIGITGVYELDDGYYELNYNFLRRKFGIEKGSTITMAGDVLDANADITAAYDANIAPYDLVEKQATAEQLVYYKQRLPFQVVLKIKGKVLKPEISFDIVLPQEKTNIVSSDVANLVEAKLSELRLNPSEMNKQVFAILILGRFISEDPFSSGANSGYDYAVRQSVSKFLSEQLNSLTSGLIKGLELNVNLNSSEDYSTGAKQNRTDLDISASKKFLDDRLKVTVGNNFELEGQAAQQQNTSLIPGNLAIDYQLTKDGRYVIRAYRKNELQNLVDGYTIETGLSFRLSVEYNKLRTVFRNRKDYRQNMKAKKREESNENKEDSSQSNKNARLEEEVSSVHKPVKK